MVELALKLDPVREKGVNTVRLKTTQLVKILLNSNADFEITQMLFTILLFTLYGQF